MRPLHSRSRLKLAKVCGKFSASDEELLLEVLPLHGLFAPGALVRLAQALEPATPTGHVPTRS